MRPVARHKMGVSWKFERARPWKSIVGALAEAGGPASVTRHTGGMPTPLVPAQLLVG